MSITKANGTIKPKHSKLEKDPKRTDPKLKLGEYHYKLKRGKKIVTNNNTIVFKEGAKYVKEKVTDLLVHPVLKLKKLKYLIKNVVLLTENNKRVKIKHIRNGFLIGELLN